MNRLMQIVRDMPITDVILIGMAVMIAMAFNVVLLRMHPEGGKPMGSDPTLQLLLYVFVEAVAFIIVGCVLYMD